LAREVSGGDRCFGLGRAEYEEKRLLGWSKQAETYNGRFAMFFLVVGLVTEYYTDVSFPGQIEEMLRVGGFIGLE